MKNYMLTKNRIVFSTQRDPVTGEKPQVDEVWYIQHTKKTKEGEVVWSDPQSEAIHVNLKYLVFSLDYISNFLSLDYISDSLYYLCRSN